MDITRWTSQIHARCQHGWDHLQPATPHAAVLTVAWACLSSGRQQWNILSQMPIAEAFTLQLYDTATEHRVHDNIKTHQPSTGLKQTW